MSKVWFITGAGRGLHPIPATCQRTQVTTLAGLADAALVGAVILPAGPLA